MVGIFHTVPIHYASRRSLISLLVAFLVIALQTRLNQPLEIECSGRNYGALKAILPVGLSGNKVS